MKIGAIRNIVSNLNFGKPVKKVQIPRELDSSLYGKIAKFEDSMNNLSNKYNLDIIIVPYKNDCALLNCGAYTTLLSNKSEDSEIAQNIYDTLGKSVK